MEHHQAGKVGDSQKYTMRKFTTFHHVSVKRDHFTRKREETIVFKSHHFLRGELLVFWGSVNEYDRIMGIMTLLKAASFFRSDVTSFLAQTNSFEFHYSKALRFFHHCITKNIKHHHNIKIKKNKSQKHLQGHQKNARDLKDSILLQIPEH